MSIGKTCSHRPHATILPPMEEKKMTRHLFYLITALAFLFSAAAVHAELYRYTDENGVVHFTDDRSEIPEKYKDQVKSQPEIPTEFKDSAREKPDTSPAETSDEPANNTPPVNDGDSNLSQKREEILQRRDALNQTYEELLKERQALEDERETVSGAQGVQAYNARVEQMDKKIEDFRQKKELLRQEIEQYNQKIEEHNQKIKTEQGS